VVVHVRQQWPSDTFHWVRVGRGNYRVHLRIFRFCF
jgi:hypothetical protein